MAGGRQSPAGSGDRAQGDALGRQNHSRSASKVVLDPATMTEAELFATLKASDMTHADRVEFLSFMRAWSRSVLPGPNLWWIRAVLYVAQWRRRAEAGSR